MTTSEKHAMTKKVSENLSSLVRLNVGGKEFCSYIAILTEREPNSMLAAMFNGRHGLFRDDKGYVFIDRNGEYFGYILDWLRDGGVPALEDLKYTQLLKEARYFQLEELVDEIRAIFGNKKKISGPDFTRSDIKYLHLKGSNERSQRTNLRGVDLSGIDLSNLDLSELNLRCACLRNTCFSGAILRHSDLSYADADGAIFDKADIKCTRFEGANLRGPMLLKFTIRNKFP